jgi:D-serine dehydratase
MRATTVAFSPTFYSPAALAGLIDAVPSDWKGAPLRDRMSLQAFAASRLSALEGALPFPLMLLREQALTHNVARMARYASDQSVLLAPHAKTSMSPELIAAQIDAGCWAITACTPAQVRTLRRLDVGRIIVANELVEPGVIRWLANELASDPSFELVCLVDSVAGVELLDRELSAAAATRPLTVMLEVGVPGGRGGARSLADAREVACAVNGSRTLELLGVEFFEGLSIDTANVVGTLADVDRQLDHVHAVASALLADGLLSRPFVSAGGSAVFDRVLARFPRPGWQVALRSGCYVSHDGGHYDDISPLAARRGTAAGPLQNAIEVWGVALSRPEPDVAVVGIGKRDVPYDISPPRAERWRPADGSHGGGSLAGSALLRLNDQHTTLRLPVGADLDVGDLVMFSISHPCGAFDRWQVIPVINAQYRITGAVHTRF